MNWETSRFLVIAHRGDTKGGVENTLPAVESALRLGVDGVEVDLRLTRDGEIVLFHDAHLRRLAGIDRRVVEEMDLADLKKVRLDGGTLPTLEELLDLVGDRFLLNLEIKTLRLFRPVLEVKLIQALRSFHLSDSLLVSSFHPLVLWRLRRLAPSLRRGYLFQKRPALHQKVWRRVAPFSVHAPLAQVSPALRTAIHETGRRFFVWTVNHEDDMKRCLDVGADGLITDEPQKLMMLLQERAKDG